VRGPFYLMLHGTIQHNIAQAGRRGPAGVGRQKTEGGSQGNCFVREETL
jgi:hypothetical protein